MEEEMEEMIKDMENVKTSVMTRIEVFGEEFPSPTAPRIYLDSVDGNFGSQRSLTSNPSSVESPTPFRLWLDSPTYSTTSSLVAEHDMERNDSLGSYQNTNDQEDEDKYAFKKNIKYSTSVE